MTVDASLLSALNFLLTLEYLEADFHSTGLSSGVIPSADRTVFQQLSLHETAHVLSLRGLIVARGGTPVAIPTFDFTARGAFSNPFAAGNFAGFLALAQLFEDTAVRAYKGQLATLRGDAAAFDAVLRIHSVEGRHAAEVRRRRGVRAWITGRDTNVTGGGAVYAGEENLAQESVASAAAVGDVTSADRATEAFDEPLTRDQVMAIISPFIV